VTLNDGRALITGGADRDYALRSAEVYDPAADAWSSAGNMSAARSGHTATLTASGAVLLVGGETTGTVEAFLADGTFLVAGKLSAPRNDYALAVLPNGKIMIAGGASDATAVASVDIYWHR
jgi:N-acetylneuraminic acid mutarotase